MPLLATRARLGAAACASLLVVLGLALHLPLLQAPLLEGAAGKQTHTAMVARNLYRGTSTLARPIVDDVGRPGYFVKELPLVPASAAALYALFGGVDESLGRLVSVVAWLAGVPLLVVFLRRDGSDRWALVAGAWWIGAPMAFVYGRAFMSDAALVTVSLAVLVAGVRWHERPGALRAVSTGALAGAALLLKPHAVFWLGPALLVLLRDRRDAAAAPARTRATLVLVAAILAGSAPAAAWYLHAASVHREFPTAGATGLEGWFDLAALGDPRLYVEILRQNVRMVFTPVGVAIAACGLGLAPRGWRRPERMLLAWGAGVLLQCLVFDTRMFDELARGTEYYQLAMVPVAGMLLSRGTAAIVARRAAGGAARLWVAAGLLALLALDAVLEARAALALPQRYASIVDDCALVRSVTSPRDELFVLADRGGTILYYCDRRGSTFVPARAVERVFAKGSNVAATQQLADALDRARYVYIPFPELLGADSAWLEFFAQNWQRVPLADRPTLLYRRPDGPR